MLSIIVAIARNGVIGDKNSLLWHIREDMVRFRELTTGHPIVMGRKTYESIGRPLPHRENVVITRQNIEIEGCRVVHSLEEAVALYDDSTEIFVIGGGQIYEEALKVAHRLYLTIIDRDYEGDTSFPEIDYTEWRETSCVRYEHGEKFDAPFAFIDFVRLVR